MDGLPEGFTDAPTPSPIAEAPAGFSTVPQPEPEVQLPEGFSAQPVAPPPPAAVGGSPTPDKTNTEVPGFWSAVGSAFGRSFLQNSNDAIAGAKVALPPDWGGKTLEQQYQEGLLHPETQDEVSRLQGENFWQGLDDPKWYGVHLAGGVGGVLPGLATGTLFGALGGGTPGFAAGFGGEAGLSTLVPAYKAARAAGLDPEAAVSRALVDSGIAAAGATAMGLAPGVSIFGRTTLDGVVNVMKRPVLEALAQIGLVQPLIGDTQHIVTTLTHGETPDPWNVAAEHIENVGMGAAMVGAHAMLAESARAAKLAVAPAVPASAERIQESFQNQNPTAAPNTQPQGPGTPPTPPAAEREVFPQREEPQPVFYSVVRRAIEEKVPNSASADQVLSTLRNTPGVKEEELQNLNLPNYLEGLDGKVNKADLLAHVEANQLVLEEVHKGTPTEFAATSVPPTESLSAYPQYVLPGEHENYREILLKTPSKDTPIQPENPDFTGSHWQEPNVLAHARVTDRFDADHKRTLHIEEIQSDWHQLGRSLGYKPAKPIDLTPLHRALQFALGEENRAEKILQTTRNIGSLEESARALARFDELTKVTDAARSALQEAKDHNSFGVVNGPFKSSWPELTVKRLLRYAADNGYERITWANGTQVGLRLGSYDELQGAREFYDKIIPSIMKKWAKKLGMQGGETRLYDRRQFDPVVEQARSLPTHIRSVRMKQLIDMGLRDNFNDRNGYVDVSPAAGERIRRGLPLYEKPLSFEVPEASLKDQATYDANYERLKNYRFNMGKLAKALAQKLGIKGSLEINFVRGSIGGNAARGRAEMLAPGKFRISVSLDRHTRPEELYSTVAHEFGHVVMWAKFEGAADHEKQAVFAAYEDWRRNLNAQTVGDVYTKRDNAIPSETGYRNTPGADGGPVYNRPLSALSSTDSTYLHHFNEWFAEQVARWATTDAKPLSLVDKFFKKLGDAVRTVVETFQKRSGLNVKPTEAMQKWLESLQTDVDPAKAIEHVADVKDKLEFDTQRKNQQAFVNAGTPEVAAPPQTASTTGGRGIINNLPPGKASSDGADMAAHGDRMNKFWEWMTSLPQIASLNKHIRGLQHYSELVQLMNVEKNNILSGAKDTLDFWKKLADPRQQVALGKFIDDYRNELYKDPANAATRTSQRPTAKEFADLATKHGLSKEALDVFDRVTKDFDRFLQSYKDLLYKQAEQIRDPKQKQSAKDSADTLIAGLLDHPFMPGMHFGKFTITVYDAKGNVRHYETTETARKQTKIAEALRSHANLLPGDTVKTGYEAKDVAPLRGMPPGLLKMMDEKLKLSATQRAALDQLMFEYAPAQSFRHQFKVKDLTPGYSTDWQRAYANFFFHGANHFTRVKYSDKLGDAIKEVQAQAKLRSTDSVKIDQIRNYMSEHMQMLLDPKPDFAALRGLMFHWYLGFNPASATLNLTQSFVMTYPHLASKFGGLGKGDVLAAKAMLKASSDLNNFYKKGNLVEQGAKAPPGPAGAGLRALGEAVKEGIITETQAHVLAAISENRNLLRAFGSKAEDAWWKFSNASSWMFEMTEQYNRRVAFRAAHDLAMRDPNNAYVAEMVRDNPQQYQRLRDQGWSHQEAAAFVAAKDTVDKTQFTYAPYARPKFMWGRKGALFIFKSFTQNTLFNLYNNPAAAGRSLLILAAMGGLMGLPGAEDANSIIKALARWYDKDFEPADEARKLAVDLTSGAINPDILLHGTAVKGFGIPAIVDALGHMIGINHVPLPVLDRSGSVSMGNILPIDVGALFAPQKDAKSNELRQIAKASGAGFSLGFALYNFVQKVASGQGGELKTWEGIMPKVLNNASHAFRFVTQGQESTNSGAAVTRFNVTDTEQMAEILARAAGYQPRRLTAQYEANAAKNDSANYWDLRKQILMSQFAAALKGGDPTEKARVSQSIRNFNQMLPNEWKPKAITAQALRDSIMTRFKDQQKLEAGVALQRQNVIGFRSLDKYYPDAKPPGAVSAQRVK